MHLDDTSLVKRRRVQTTRTVMMIEEVLNILGDFD